LYEYCTESFIAFKLIKNEMVVEATGVELITRTNHSVDST
jgi:hypothetical protein